MIASSELVVHNLKTVLDNIAELCAHSTKTAAAAVRLVAVSKTFPVDAVWLCYRLGGQRHFGENYVQELETKARQMAEKGSADQIRWHYIGRVQSSMINRLCAVPNLWCVETVDSAKHANGLQKAMNTMGKSLNIFIQVNTSDEPNKGGVRADELLELARHIMEQCHALTLFGLMTIGSIDQSLGGGDANADFARLRQLRDKLQTELGLSNELELSMGMSADYQLAIKYGSTNVRVGSTIFGARNYAKKRMGDGEGSNH